jgi:transposase InsO family protein
VRGNTIEPEATANARWSLTLFTRVSLQADRTGSSISSTVCTSEMLAIVPAFSFGSADVIRVIEAIAFERALPTTLLWDNGSEFSSRRMLSPGRREEHSPSLH